MPAFARDGVLTDDEIGLLADWLRQDWYRAERQGRGRGARDGPG